MKSVTDRILLAVFVTLLVLASSVEAELTWERKEVRLKAGPLEKEVVAHYPFRNDGNEVIKFKSFQSTCGCISITTSTMVVPPGVAGEVTVTFAPEFRLGQQKRPIAIQFDDENRTRMALYLQVEIPEIIRPQPLFLKWSHEEAIESKAVTILTDGNYPVESIRVRSAHPGWETKVTRIDDSRDYKLEVLPRRGPGPQAQYVELEAKLADGQVKRTNLYVVVR